MFDGVRSVFDRTAGQRCYATFFVAIATAFTRTVLRDEILITGGFFFLCVLGVLGGEILITCGFFFLCVPDGVRSFFDRLHP